MKTNIDVSLDEESLSKNFDNFSNHNSISKMGRSNSSPDNDYDEIYKRFKQRLASHIKMLKIQVQKTINN